MLFSGELVKVFLARLFRTHDRKMRALKKLCRRLSHGANSNPYSPLHQNKKNSIVYVVNHSFPYSSNGYAVRTHGIASALVKQGVTVFVLNRPGRPWDLPGYTAASSNMSHDIDGVSYRFYRTPSCKGVSLEMYLSMAIEFYKETFQNLEPCMVLAASNWENALPAGIAARELGLPFCYEVRGFWELSRASREPEFLNSQAFRNERELESLVAQSADRVYTLNTFMRQELLQRGVSEERIDIVPNAYGELPDLSRPSLVTKTDIGINTNYVVAYIGSFAEYEGLEDLIAACATLRSSGLDLSLLLVGSANPFGSDDKIDNCEKCSGFKAVATKLGFAEHLYLPGRVAPDKLADYYKMIDLVVIPRKALPVCELVSPIKPYEAMAFGKAVLFSDVAPLKELAEQAGAPTFRKSDTASLSNEIKALLQNDECRNRLGRKLLCHLSTKCKFGMVIKPILTQSIV